MKKFNFFLVCVFLLSCSKQPGENGQQKAAEKFQEAYDKWHAVVDIMSPYSKPTPYIETKEFENIVACGPEIVPFLQGKIEKDAELDYVLIYAVMKIKNWKQEEFMTNKILVNLDDVKLRVIEKLNKNQ